MLETITVGNIFVEVIITGAILFIFLIFVAFRIESLFKHFERQRFVSDLKNQIKAELKDDTNK